MDRAHYKCLDDLVQEGLHESIVKDLDKAEKIVTTITGKKNIKDVSVKEILAID